MHPTTATRDLRQYLENGIDWQILEPWLRLHNLPQDCRELRPSMRQNACHCWSSEHGQPRVLELIACMCKACATFVILEACVADPSCPGSISYAATPLLTLKAGSSEVQIDHMQMQGIDTSPTRCMKATENRTAMMAKQFGGKELLWP